MKRMWDSTYSKLIQPIRALLFRHEKPVLVLGGAALLTSTLFQFDLSLFEAKLYDLRMAKGRQPSPSPSIALIALDDTSAKDLDDFLPFSLSLHTQLLEKLEAVKPKALGYLVDMNQVHQVNPDLFDQEWGLRFVQAADRFESKGVPFVLGTPYEVTGEILPPYPLSTLKHSIAFIHKDGNVFAEDKVTRRALTHINDRPVFHSQLAGLAGDAALDKSFRGSYYIPEVDSRFFFFRYHGNTTWSQRPGAAQAKAPYSLYSFSEVISGKVPAESFRDKYVLVGTLSRENLGDFALTPFSKQSLTHPKLFLHANILNSILEDDGILRAPTWANWLMTFTTTAIVIWWVIQFTPLLGVVFTAALATLAIAFGFLVFQNFGLWIRLSQPIVGIFLSYYLVVPYRLVREYKKRWDYQQKNEVLTQVEDLKTHFLSLVTHDLKTPVARIQGLTEVLIRNVSAKLDLNDRETLRNILKATEDLNHFITSILELNRVESDKLSLTLESRDINLIIEKAVEAFRINAQQKQIQLHTELEPLFPLKFDAALISKVLNNLIENAIKYSPNGSTIRIESREIEGFVEVSVSDQGMGIRPEDLKNLFTRFYRVKSEEMTGIPGTGLGLYLSKYFVEAHRGNLTVASELGRGSRFQMRLPLELEIDNLTTPVSKTYPQKGEKNV